MKEETVQKEKGTGISVARLFTQKGENPFEKIEYEKRNAKISEPDGRVVFELKDVSVPRGWSQLATDIAVSKYFRKTGVPNTGHETSVKEV
ncbi:hypothetical protein COV61_03330, partial [Candidatus Micrarchaeota archaeon CG11_big_fil_rev_8_21_14_0_20_47_5]